MVGSNVLCNYCPLYCKAVIVKPPSSTALSTLPEESIFCDFPFAYIGNESFQKGSTMVCYYRNAKQWTQNENREKNGPAAFLEIVFTINVNNAQKMSRLQILN